MPKFDASSVVEPLDYDLNPYVNVKGTITEPTDAVITRFSIAWRKEIIGAARDMGADPMAIEKMSAEEIFDILEKIDPEKIEATIKKQAELHSQLCGGHPTAAQLMKLPPRVRIHFFKWLSDELMHPEAVTGAGNGQVIRLPSQAAG